VARRIAQCVRAGTKPEQEESLRDACIRQLDAESQLAAAQSALAQLETSIEAHQYVIAQANKQANEAALAVIAAATERLCGLEVQDHLKFCRKLHRKIARLLAAQDPIDISGGATPDVYEVDSVGEQTAVSGKGR
jgi:hypothetical protein